MLFFFPRHRVKFNLGLLMVVTVGAFGANAANLYLLAATASSSYVDFPVRLYRVDAPTGAVRLEKNVARGMSCVLVDYGGRRLVVASPALMSNEFSFIEMNAPNAIVTKQLATWENGALPGEMYLLDLPGLGPGVAFTVDKVDMKTQNSQYPPALTFVGLKSPDAPASLSFDNLRYLRVAGEVGGAVYMHNSHVVLRGDPLEVEVLRASPADGAPVLGIPRPPYLKGRNTNEGFQLVVNDDARTVMLPTEPGVMDVLNKKSGEWRRMPMPFQGAMVRGFGPWLAMIEAQSSGVVLPAGQSTVKREDIRVARGSPGDKKRRTEEIFPPYRETPAMTVDDLFGQMHERGTFFPGELAILNLDTGVQMKISAGAGDSEVVLVTDDAVYYRVDDVLYRRQINGASLGNPVTVAHGDEIVQVHWAFLN